jgi:D-glycero-beta-D-manno-heptose 1-phosphate adenylyltransferase
LKQSSNKILVQSELKDQVIKWQADGEKVVFSNGCFDILHLGHIDYLEKARALGTKLVIGLNADASVTLLKGSNRPINNELARARMLAALQFVDGVTVFNEETPEKLIDYLLPDILVKGKDYSIENIVGAKTVLNNGGEVKTINLVDGYSTSNLIERIKN